MNQRIGLPVMSLPDKIKIFVFENGDFVTHIFEGKGLIAIAKELNLNVVMLGQEWLPYINLQMTQRLNIAIIPFNFNF